MKTLQAIFIVAVVLFVGEGLHVLAELMVYGPKCAPFGGGC
jgi:hypothetical protein